jgi:abequosyltransferase
MNTSHIDRPLLTIAIPTYNRARYLSALLHSLSEQVGNDSRVELLISDNASSDETPALIDSLKDKGALCRYIRNQENIGPDKNFLQCYTEASGKYVWIVGDDDMVLPGAVERIVSQLSTEDYDLVYVNSVFLNGESPLPAGLTRVTRPLVYTDSVAFARRIHVFFTFISGNIVNKNRIEKIAHKPFSELLNTNLIQLSWTYTALQLHQKSLYFEDRLIVATGGNTGGYGLFRVFGERLSKITQEWLEDPALRRVILNGTLRFFFPSFLLEAKKSALGSFVKEDPDNTLRPYFGNNLRYWIFVYPLIVLPVSLGRIWLFGLRVFNKLYAVLIRTQDAVSSLLGN